MIVQIASHLGLGVTTWFSEPISMVGANSILIQVITINATTSTSVGTAAMEGSNDKETWTLIGSAQSLTDTVGGSVEKDNGPFGYAFVRAKVNVTVAPFVLAIVGNTYSK